MSIVLRVLLFCLLCSYVFLFVLCVFVALLPGWMEAYSNITFNYKAYRLYTPIIYFRYSSTLLVYEICFVVHVLDVSVQIHPL